MNAIAAPLTSKGRLECDLCDAPYDHTIIVDHAKLTPRQQLRQAASREGWKQTSAGLDVCPACVAGAAAFLIPGWTVIWGPEGALAPLRRDLDATEVMAAVEDAA
jgi:hypothetical protein